MGSGIRLSVLVSCSGCVPSLYVWTLSAFRRCIVCLCLSVLRGSSLPVSVVLSLVALHILVVVLFFFGLLCPWLTHGVTTLVVISNVNSCSVVNRFGCVVFMRPIATLHVTSFSMIFR